MSGEPIILDSSGGHMNVFCSLFPYALSKRHAVEAWPAVLSREVEAPTLPCFRTLRTLRGLVDVQLHVSVVARLGFARSQAVGAFLRSGCELWATCDDDVEADGGTIGRMLRASVALNGLVGAPYAARTARGMVVGDIPHDAVPSLMGVCGWIVPAWTVGAGLSVVSRSAVLQMVDHFPELRFVMRHADGSEEQSWALYQEAIVREQWAAEDVTFCARAFSAHVPRYLLLDAQVTHEGATLSVPHEGPALDALRMAT